MHTATLTGKESLQKGIHAKQDEQLWVWGQKDTDTLYNLRGFHEANHESGYGDKEDLNAR